MTISRIETAFSDGLLDLPTGGRILVMRCSPEFAHLLPADRVDVVHGFAPAYAAWERAGANMLVDPSTGYAMAIVTCPRAKDFARHLVAQGLHALSPGGVMVVDGQKTDGIEPLLKALKSQISNIEVLSKSHGKLLVFVRPESLPAVITNWQNASPKSPDAWVTALGMFSAEAVDKGSVLLSENLPNLKGCVCDLGAGWGYLSRAILHHAKVQRLDLVEAERAALEAAKHNIKDPRAAFHWADAQTFGAKKSYDFVVTNPPFHTGRAADPSLGQMFLTRAKYLLKPNGTLALVANRHLPYERTLNEGFAKVETIALTNGFKVIHATRPRQSR